MDSRNTPRGDSIDWNDPMFAQTHFDESMTGDSLFATSAFNDFTTLDYSDSPGLSLRLPTRDGRDSVVSGAQLNQSTHMQPSTSAESSSQDSASDSSSRRKRKVTSESPLSDGTTEQPVKQEDTMMELAQGQKVQQFDQTFTRPMHNLSLERDDAMGSHFTFNSAASSPVQPRDFNATMSLNAHVNLPTSTVAPQYQQSPVQTINPGMFQIGPSRDESPAVSNMMFNNASPNAIFSSPSSESNDTFNGNPMWNNGMAPNPAWPAGYNNQFNSPDGFGLTPSPIVNGGSPAMPSQVSAVLPGRSPLHIAPISTKSRVETQINIIMTLEKPPPGIENLHLPLHTIAKSKLLAKEEYEPAKSLELHTMLVCTSAMNNPAFKEKALKRAAAQNNMNVQKRADQLRDAPDEEKNNMKDVDEADKPANGGEVRICNNCIQRERKRAGRKKLKKEEEQQHWEKYETERVVVFNSNEYLPFKLYEPGQPPQREGGAAVEDAQYTPPEGAMHVSAAMRIACYCRHQSEKEGFRVIFTLKDQQSNVVAQQMSDSILITDDHKTHPQSFSANMPGEVFYQSAAFAPAGLPTSYSMVDLSQQVHPFTSSRSTGNLQAMGYGQQHFNPHSHVHQLPSPGFTSQTASTAITPTSLSRPGSPTSAGQSGPNKKRKSSSFHRRVPSGLTMTPRVDTSQPPASNMPSAMPLTSPFSPTSANGFSGQTEPSFMTMPNQGGPTQYYGSGPPTPNENGQFGFNPAPVDIARAQNAQVYFSHPSSAVPSRASSPVLQSSRPNMAAYARHPIQTPTNSIQGRQQQVYGGPQAAPGSSGGEQELASPPTITKITPSEGPVSGGTEVSIYGYNFTNGTQVMFGEQLATTVFYGPQALLATSPPSRPGSVNVALVPPANSPPQYASPPTSRQIFTYTDTNPRMMEMALRFLSQQQTGSQVPWNQFTNQVATKFIQNNMSPAGIRGQGFDSANVLAAGSVEVEELVLKIFDLVDVSESPRQPCYDLASQDGQTMLSLACAFGMHRIAAALLARGANPDVRDKGGYTPLMHAALHGQKRTFQLLVVKGADPTMRSLQGYAAIDLASKETREEYQLIVQNTPRSRHVRPLYLSRKNSDSSAASQASWDISSASFYESDTEGSEPHSLSALPSRRASAQHNFPIPPMADDALTSPHLPNQVLSTSAAMLAWRDTLAAQIHHFQQSVHWNMMPHFQLPAMPPLPTLPDYQDSAMVRRLSSLVPGSRCQTPATLPPPAYNELFPEKTRAEPPPPPSATKLDALRTAAVDALADAKCTALFDMCSSSASSDSGSSPASEKDAGGLVRSAAGRLPSWLLMPLLVILTSIIMHVVVMPRLSPAETPGVTTTMTPPPHRISDAFSGSS